MTNPNSNLFGGKGKRRRRGGGATVAALVVGLSALLIAGLFVDWSRPLPEAPTETSYVGGARCADCHQQESKEWQGSHHDLAMDRATEETVLGDFADQSLTHFGVNSRMFRDGDKFMVHTEGPDGTMADFEVKYVFGVTPLQQYMVEMEPAPGEALGRVQVLRLSWDTLRRRWFYLSPPDVTEKLAPNDPLHWTRAGQNWNHMCADCHSTNLQKGFQLASAKYHTTFSDIDVSCEACHGPGSLHVGLAERWSLFWSRSHGKGLSSLKSADSVTEVESCAPCHSRRAHVQEGFVCGADYYDHYENELLTSATYYPDGQIFDEVYVYGSFLQSKMYAKGVRCTDCHQPHSLKLKYEDNRLCTSCHQQQHHPAKYDTPAHHFHPPESTGARCVECHMMATPYMDVDFRRDHRFHIPRPRESLEFGTPNACASCHLRDEVMELPERSDLEHYADWLAAARTGDEEATAALNRVNRWAATAMEKWGQQPSAESETFTETLQRGWQGDATVQPDLIALADDHKRPGIVRATAVQSLMGFNETAPLTLEKIQDWLKDDEPQVRAAAIQFMEFYPVAQRSSYIAPLLLDPRRNVRIQAAASLVDASKVLFSDQRLEALETSLKELRKQRLLDGDQAGSHMALALLAERQGRWREATEHYRDAIRVQPEVTGPRSNLANLLSQRFKDEEAAQVLRREEMDLMIRDAEYAPEDALVQYRLGLNFYLNGRYGEAARVLQRVVELQPDDARYVLTLTLLWQKMERWQEALQLCDRLIDLVPDHAPYRQLRQQLRQQAAAAE